MNIVRNNEYYIICLHTKHINIVHELPWESSRLCAQANNAYRINLDGDASAQLDLHDSERNGCLNQPDLGRVLMRLRNKSTYSIPLTLTNRLYRSKTLNDRRADNHGAFPLSYIYTCALSLLFIYLNTSREMNRAITFRMFSYLCAQILASTGRNIFDAARFAPDTLYVRGLRDC